MEDEIAGEAVSASKRHKPSSSEQEEIVGAGKAAAGDGIEEIASVNTEDSNAKGHDCVSDCLPSAEIHSTDNNNEKTAGTDTMNMSNDAKNKVKDSTAIVATSGKQFAIQNDTKPVDTDNEPSAEQDSGLAVDVTNLSTESTNIDASTASGNSKTSPNAKNSSAMLDSDDDMSQSSVLSPLNRSDQPFSTSIRIAEDSSDDSSLQPIRPTGCPAPDMLMTDSSLSPLSSTNKRVPADLEDNGALNSDDDNATELSSNDTSPQPPNITSPQPPNDNLMTDSSSSSLSPTNRNAPVDLDDNGALNGDAAAAAGTSGNNDGDNATDGSGRHLSRRTSNTYRNMRHISFEVPLSSSSSSSPSSILSSDHDSSLSTLPVPSPEPDSIFSPPDTESDGNDNDDSDSDDNDDDNGPNASNRAPSPGRGDAENRTKEAVDDVLKKEKSAYSWHSTHELMWREHGLTANRQSSLRNVSSLGFNARFYSSRHVVERMKFSHMLRKHTGCVNCLNFNRTGDLLCSGSDDTRIIVWDWAKNEHKHVFDSGHTANIFQAKFLDTSGCIIIISASRDGQVRRSVIPSSGGIAETECLYKHTNAVHKIVISPQNYNEIISVGEDALVMHYDLRTNNDAVELTKVYNTRNKKVRLYSISHHPFATEFCVSGFDSIVRVYDKRNCAKPVREMYPESLNELTMPQVTCAVYNNTGSEILASYSDEHIYLFDNKNYKSGEFLHRYRGHYNHRTIKGVNFFGPNSEYIISGSDCGHIFYWDKETEAILNFMAGDRMGVVNCLEPHPSIPILATSGLDNNVKIWAPNSDTYPPDLKHLERCVYRNLKRSAVEEIDFDDRQFHYLMRQFFRSGPAPPRNGSNDSDDDSDQSIVFFSSSSSSSGNDDDDNDDEAPLETLHCRTQ